MLNTRKNSLKLLGRNEGKIKCYESCLDVRAWSHDMHVRDRYLRDWIKSDMPICVVPVCTVASFLDMMTWRRNGKVTPRCHPDCKSKVVLDSICNSCHSIKECLKNEESFNKYFVEEEFETTHWPCDRCLEALKSVKMFWKIILDKIFNINVAKNESSSAGNKSNESIKIIAKNWESEIIEQTLVVKALSPILIHLEEKSFLKDIGTDMESKCNLTNKGSSKCLRKKISKCTSSAKTKSVNIGCNTCNCNVETRQSKIQILQKQLSDELKQLKRENASLRLQLQHIICNSHNRPTCNIGPPPIISDCNSVAPIPYESCSDNEDVVKDIDSEMVISLKSCKNKQFRHVSMFQVLHKTNTCVDDDVTISNGRKKEDPIEILTKVQTTFEAIMEREFKIANKNKLCKKDVNKNASYQELKTEKSPQVVKSSHSTIANSIFQSTTEVLWQPSWKKYQ